MKNIILLFSFAASISSFATPQFAAVTPSSADYYLTNTSALCATARETLKYLNRGSQYDPQVIHEGKVISLPLARIKATLVFVCQYQDKMNDPAFIRKNFEFIRWYPDLEKARAFKNKRLIYNLPNDKILMTKYYVHLAKASKKRTESYPFALYALPQDESSLSLEQADAKSNLIRHHYGKQAILKGALNNKKVPILAYLKRKDLEAALLQGTMVADFGDYKPLKTFNVHRSNNIPYDKAKNPYEQERYWYFKSVDGIKGYGKDADQKITVRTEATFAADLEQFGLGKLLMVQYANQQGKKVTRIGVFADTGGAFKNNLYQVDFLTGSYSGVEAFSQASRHLPDYVTAFFMVLKQ